KLQEARIHCLRGETPLLGIVVGEDDPRVVLACHRSSLDLAPVQRFEFETSFVIDGAECANVGLIDKYRLNCAPRQRGWRSRCQLYRALHLVRDRSLRTASCGDGDESCQRQK